MIITPIADGPLDPLQRFIARLGTSATTFRYFQSRPPEIVRGHLVTLLGCENEEPVCYGHLEREGEVVWLGLCVREGDTGRGLGGAMLAALLDAAEKAGVERVRLAVDDDNRIAIHLYERAGFRLIEERGGRRFMERQGGAPVRARE